MILTEVMGAFPCCHTESAPHLSSQCWSAQGSTSPPPILVQVQAPPIHME